MLIKTTLMLLIALVINLAAMPSAFAGETKVENESAF